MYISYNWLKDFVKIPAKIKPEEVAEQLTNQTVEVENLTSQADQYDKVIVGKVLEVEKHPNADRLRLAVVDIKKTKLRIVCGAPNLAVGQLVPVALIGAILPGGLEIKESEIRGEKSSGMICAEDELGLGKNHEGIIVLSPEAKIGEPFARYLRADDIILEVDNKSLSNRPDLLGHYGLARELAAIFNLNLKPYEKVTSSPEFLNPSANKLEVKVEDPELCPRYCAVKIENVKVQESPNWLKARLIAIGQRPINNIVDLTNYVMFEIGQPLHAFNATDLKKIIIRRAKDDESLITLDEKERLLSKDDLVIADNKQVLAIAGVMGGWESEIKPATTALILESANFKAVTIRKTAQKLSLRTEASSRFEKSLDPTLTKPAIFRFLDLLRETCPDLKIASSLVDVDNTKPLELEIDLDLNWLTAKIGQEIPRDQVINILNKLGFKIANKKAEILKVTVPSWRATKDISTREDLVEEVLRLYGYNRIDSQLPVQTLSLPETNQERLLERKIKNILALKFSLTEIYNYSFNNEDQLKKMKIDFFNYLKLANPLSEEQKLLRQSLIPGLTGNIKINQYRSDNLGFFEIGRVFFNAPGNFRKENSDHSTLPYQEKHLGLALAANDENLFGRLKGLINSLLQTLVDPQTELEFFAWENFPGWADKNQSAKIIFGAKEIGQLALVDPETSANLNLRLPAVLAELNFTLLTDLILNLPTSHFREAPKYPPVMRDLAFVVNEKILYNDLKMEIINFDPLIKSVELFDVYAGDKLENGEKSLAFHLSYQSELKTLTAEEVGVIQGGLIKHLTQKFDAQLRDF